MLQMQSHQRDERRKKNCLKVEGIDEQRTSVIEIIHSLKFIEISSILAKIEWKRITPVFLGWLSIEWIKCNRLEFHN